MNNLDPFSVKTLSLAALGAFALWVRLRYGANLLKGFDKLWEDLYEDFHIRVLFQVLMFVSLGSIMAIVLAEPTTGRQALAAGMGWTALLGGLATAGQRRAKNA
jgi:hypothetical protein